MSRLRFVLAAVFAWGCGFAALAPAAEQSAAGVANPRFTGSPLLRAWLAQDYGAHPETNGIAQDPRTGLIYVGTRGAVLEFDGARWQLIKLPREEAVISLVHDGRGRLWAATTGDIFLIVTDARGEWQAISQRARLPEPFQFSILQAVALPEGVYVRDNMRAAFFPIDDGVPWIKKLTGHPIVLGEMWAMDGRVHILAGQQTLRLRGGSEGEFDRLPRWGGGHVLDTRQRADGSRDVALPGALERWSDTAQLGTLRKFEDDSARCALFLRDGRVAFGMNRSGVVICAADGRVVQTIDRARGLPANAISALLEDRDRGLWVATPFGVARIELDSPYALHGPAQKLEGTTVTFARHEGSLHVGGSEGAWRREANGEFRPLAGAEQAVRDLTPLGGNLYIESRLLYGVLAGEANHPPRVLEGRNYYGLVPLTTAPGWFVHGCNEGIRWARFEGDTWTHYGPLAAIDHPARVWLEEPAGIIWATVGATVHRIDFRAGPAKEASAPALATPLPSPPRIFRLGSEVVAFAGGGFHRFVATAGRFVPYPLIRGFEDATQNPIRLVHLAEDGTLWFLPAKAPGEIWHATPNANGGLWNAEKFAAPPLRDLRPTGLFHEAATRTLWVATHGTLISVDLGWKPTRETPPPGAIVRRVETATGELIFGGMAAQAGGQAATFRAAQTALRFAFAAPVFSGDHRGAPRLQYRTKLDGLDDAWTTWTSETQRDFTNLPWRRFTFRVQARDHAGHSGAETSFAFAIAAPWWATPWAFTGYATAAGLGLVAIFRLRTRALRRRNERLETLIAERTREAHTAKMAAEAANRAKSTFLANMSHELRTPLNAILGFAQILRRAPDLPAPHRDRLAIIARNGDHLLALINEVLDLSKIEAGKLAIAPAPFPLARLLAVTADTFAQRARDKGLEFRATLAPDLPAHVEGDEAKLRQVLFNLLGNALKFTERGHVELRVTRAESADARGVRFEVADSGIGIAADEVERIFEPFQQGRRNPLAAPGTGLGLAISQHIVELMGGVIRVESEPGRGSRFWFELTLPLAAAPVPAGPRRTINGYTGARKRLLVVDDEPANRDVIRGLLEPLGFQIEECADGEAAVSLFQQRRPDAVLLDLRMPGPLDGLATARALRRLPAGAEPAIIAVSASVFEEDRHTAIDAGCDDFLPKPFNEERLFNTLGAHLELTWTLAEAAPSSSSPFGTTSRRPLPVSEAEPLLELARRGDIRNFRARLKSVASRHPESASMIEHLDHLAAGFQLGALRRELGRDIEPHAPSPAS